MSRPTKLNDEVQRKIVDLVRVGNFLETAAEAAGLERRTVTRWLTRGSEEESGPFREFREAVEKAQAESESRDVALIAKAAKDDWQAAAWRLERKFPAKYAVRVRQVIEEELKRLLDRLESGLDGPTYQRVLELIVTADGRRPPIEVGGEHQASGAPPVDPEPLAQLRSPDAPIEPDPEAGRGARKAAAACRLDAA